VLLFLLDEANAMRTAWKFVVVGLLTTILVGIACAVAIRQTHLVSPQHIFAYYLATNTLAVVIILVTPAFGFFILQRSGTRLPGWLSFWVFAYLVYLVSVVASGSLATESGTVANQAEIAGRASWIDWLVVVWWGLDVLVALTIGGTTGPLRLARGALHVVVFAVLLLKSLESDAWYLHVLGIFMVLAALIFALLRVVVVEFDRNSLAGRVFIGAFDVVDRFIPWHRLPTPLAVLNLTAFREVLRAKNLHNTSDIPISRPENLAATPLFQSEFLYERHIDGYYNDLGKPAMGSARAREDATHDSMEFTHSNPGARFGRNVPLAYTYPSEPLLLTPSPREISRRLLARKKFLPAEALNLLAAAWIQFQTHDWFNHGNPSSEDPFDVPLGEGDAWHECPMHVRRTRPDPTRNYAAERQRAARDAAFKPAPPSYVNAESHWWDASQIYGSDAEKNVRLARWRHR
jgi:hypothetical protein